jgi:lipoic acid synthetase
MSKTRPEWVRFKVPSGATSSFVVATLRRNRLHTVCEEARCPNQGECFGSGTATFLILGAMCTRHCKFCGVKTGNPGGVIDEGEPERVARAVLETNLRYVVITSVDRDDLEDGGAQIYARTIKAIKKVVPDCLVEVLIPDYLGKNLETVLEAGPDVLGHNIETVRRLTPLVRDKRASYEKSLQVLREAQKINPSIPTKSSIMVGLGETREEVVEALLDLRSCNVSFVTIGQYLKPDKRALDVQRYWTPQEFEWIRQIALAMGFRFVASAPLVRSSYRAFEAFMRSPR